MRPKTEKKLPKIFIWNSNGNLYLQQVKCGKKNCKCARGEQHIAYYYIRREGGILRKTYIRKSELNEFRKRVTEIVLLRNRFRENAKRRKIYLKELRARNKAIKASGIKEEHYNVEYLTYLINKVIDEPPKSPCGCPACKS